MNIRQLEQDLISEGCNPGSYAIGERGQASDAYCLTFSDGLWRVYYSERGVDQPPFFESADEAEACAYFSQFILRFRHDHLVGLFHHEASAQALRAVLARYGISSHQDVIPYTGADAPRYRVFVTGKAIFAVRELLGDVPLTE